jgi:hypothetical protein
MVDVQLAVKLFHLDHLVSPKLIQEKGKSFAAHFDRELLDKGKEPVNVRDLVLAVNENDTTLCTDGRNYSLEADVQVILINL